MYATNKDSRARTGTVLARAYQTVNDKHYQMHKGIDDMLLHDKD